jgi:uncharacterized protein (TIGR03435 family)
MRLKMLVMLALVISPGMGFGQAAPAKLPEYDVATVKVNHTGSGSTRYSIDDGNLLIQNASLVGIIWQAYSLFSASDDQITGLPGWAKTERFDVEAKVVDPDLKVLEKLTKEQRGLMLLAVLKDRFKLVAHLETREQPLYSLVVAKGGSKLTKAKDGDTYAGGLMGPDGKPRGGGSMNTRRGAITAQGVPLIDLTAELTQRLDRTVVDKTGLTGNFDFHLEWTPDDSAVESTAAAPPLFTALQEQLGLKLEPGRGPVPVLVLDHIEEPTAN